MTDKTPAKKSAFIISDFEDAGTREAFSAGDTVLIEAGAFGNYEAAGLVRAPTADDKKAVATAS